MPIPEPLPGTSGLNNSGYALNIESEDTGSDFSVEDDDQVKCCICDKWEPDALKSIADVTFVEWAECVTSAGTGHISGFAQPSDTLWKAVNSDALTVFPKCPKL